MKNCLCFLLFLASAGVGAQNEFAKWYFGRYTGLDFMTTPPTVINHTTMNTFEGCASAADGAGNLLFYTDGITLWNKQQLVMANGTGLFGNGSTVQAALIVKQPGNPNVYYVFTLDYQGGPNGLRYSLVDMSLAAGMGSVTIKNVPVTTPCTEQLTGVRHCNGVDVWIVSHDLNGNNFRSYLLSSSGLNFTPVISGVGPAVPTFTPNNTIYGQGTIKISPSGKKLGLTYFNGSNNCEVAVFDFDRSSGIISNYLSLMTSTVNCYGCEFSGDGTKFYTGSLTAPVSIFQWDLCAGSNSQIVASKTSIGTPPISPAQLQLAPNGKIYVVNWGTQTLSAILNPDLPGTAATFTPFALSVATGTNGTGLPNFIGGVYKNLPAFTYTAACNTVTFTAPPLPTVNVGCGASDYPLLGLTWIFGNPISAPSNTSGLNNPVHNFSGPGAYQVKLVLNRACGADTIYQNVVVNPPTPISLAIITTTAQACAGSSVNLTAQVSGGSGFYAYNWSAGGSGPGIIASQSSSGTVTYSLSVSDPNGCSTGATASTQVTFLPLPVLSAQSKSICLNAKATVTVSGAASYTWVPGNSVGQTFTASPSATQVYTVSGSDANGCTGLATATVFVSKCVPVQELHRLENVLKFYPNPASGEIFIESALAVDIVIVDVAGRELIRKSLAGGENRVTLEILGSGVYFIKTNSAGKSRVDKIIKID